MSNIIELRPQEYEELVQAANRWYALEEAGVDNWSGYGDVDWEAWGVER